MKRNHVFVGSLCLLESGLHAVQESDLRDVMIGLESDCPSKGSTLSSLMLLIKLSIYIIAAPGHGEEDFCIK